MASRHRGRKGRLASNKQEAEMVRSLDELAEFQEYRDKILRRFHKMLKDGAEPQEILKVAQSLAAARLGSMAATEFDSGKALSAIKDLLDRTQGRATEKKEVQHKFEKLTDEELDSLVASKLGALQDEEEENQTH